MNSKLEKTDTDLEETSLENNHKRGFHIARVNKRSGPASASCNVVTLKYLPQTLTSGDTVQYTIAPPNQPFLRDSPRVLSNPATLLKRRRALNAFRMGAIPSIETSNPKGEFLLNLTA